MQILSAKNLHPTGSLHVSRNKFANLTQCKSLLEALLYLLTSFNLWLLTGSKPALVDQLSGVYIAATEAGMSPEAYRTRQLEEKRRPSKKITTKTDMDDAMENWSLAQLRQAVQEKGMRPRGMYRYHICVLIPHLRKIDFLVR